MEPPDIDQHEVEKAGEVEKIIGLLSDNPILLSADFSVEQYRRIEAQLWRLIRNTYAQRQLAEAKEARARTRQSTEAA